MQIPPLNTGDTSLVEEAGHRRRNGSIVIDLGRGSIGIGTGFRPYNSYGYGGYNGYNSDPIYSGCPPLGQTGSVQCRRERRREDAERRNYERPQYNNRYNDRYDRRPPYYDRGPSDRYSRDAQGDVRFESTDPLRNSVTSNGVVSLNELEGLLRKNNFNARELNILQRDAADNSQLDDPRALREVFGRNVQIGSRDDGPNAPAIAAQMIQSTRSR